MLNEMMLGGSVVARPAASLAETGELPEPVESVELVANRGRTTLVDETPPEEQILPLLPIEQLEQQLAQIDLARAHQTTDVADMANVADVADVANVTDSAGTTASLLSYPSQAAHTTRAAHTVSAESAGLPDVRQLLQQLLARWQQSELGPWIERCDQAALYARLLDLLAHRELVRTKRGFLLVLAPVLYEMRESRGWRHLIDPETGEPYRSWEQWCQRRFGFSHTRATNLINLWRRVIPAMHAQGIDVARTLEEVDLSKLELIVPLLVSYEQERERLLAQQAKQTRQSARLTQTKAGLLPAWEPGEPGEPGMASDEAGDGAGDGASDEAHEPGESVRSESAESSEPVELPEPPNLHQLLAMARELSNRDFRQALLVYSEGTRRSEEEPLTVYVRRLADGRYQLMLVLTASEARYFNDRLRPRYVDAQTRELVPLWEELRRSR
jgi:hypothetical protein